MRSFLKNTTFPALFLAIFCLFINCQLVEGAKKTKKETESSEAAKPQTAGEKAEAIRQKRVKEFFAKVQKQVEADHKRRKKNLRSAGYLPKPPVGEVNIRNDAAKPNSWQPHVKARAINACSYPIWITDENGYVLANLPPDGASISILARRDPYRDSNYKEVIWQAQATIDGKTYVVGEKRYQLSAWESQTRLRQAEVWTFCPKSPPPEKEPETEKQPEKPAEKGTQ